MWEGGARAVRLKPSIGCLKRWSALCGQAQRCLIVPKTLASKAVERAVWAGLKCA